jgi:hypothetical protein
MQLFQPYNVYLSLVGVEVWMKWNLIFVNTSDANQTVTDSVSSILHIATTMLSSCRESHVVFVMYVIHDSRNLLETVVNRRSYSSYAC